MGRLWCGYRIEAKVRHAETDEKHMSGRDSWMAHALGKTTLSIAVVAMLYPGYQT